MAILYGGQSIKKKWLGLAVLSLTALVDLQTQLWFGAVKALNIAHQADISANCSHNVQSVIGLVKQAQRSFWCTLFSPLFACLT